MFWSNVLHESVLVSAILPDGYDPPTAAALRRTLYLHGGVTEGDGKVSKLTDAFPSRSSRTPT